MDVAALGRFLGACIVVGLVLAGVRVVAARLGRVGLERGAGGTLLALVETAMLPGSATLHVVRVVDRYYVIGRNAAAFSTLCEIPGDSVERYREARYVGAAVASPIGRFAGRFRKRA